MGLRSLYYFLAYVIDNFVNLKKAISFILAFIGVKMLIADQYPIPIHVSLKVILFVLSMADVVPVAVRKRQDHHIRD
jgi:tellurite resistance protein TerC